MKNFKLNFLLISIISILFRVDAQAQEFYKLQSQNSKLIIEGTSSIHDWKMEAENFNAETLLKVEGGAISEISKVEFFTPVSGLKSGKSIMDKKAYDALKEKKSPEIKFSLNKNNNVSISGAKANLTGLLTVAGKSKEVKVSANFDVENPQKFLVSGSVPIKMSDFEIDPPTAMMGTIKRVIK
ncbi:MAG: YceI family protein [Mariniphaga sp.]|nr:YceI family protein [Mariniphaga sp.]